MECVCVCGWFSGSLVKWAAMSEDAKSKKGLMCQETSGCIKLLSTLPCSCDTVCIPNMSRREETACRCVCPCVCVLNLLHSKCWCSVIYVCVLLSPSSQAVCHLELHTDSALAKKTWECTHTTAVALPQRTCVRVKCVCVCLSVTVHICNWTLVFAYLKLFHSQSVSII